MKKRKFHTEVQQLIDSNALDAIADSNNFIDFLCSCAERLNKGKQVRAIWRDYQDQAD